MEQIGVREAQAQLPELLARVGRGERFEIVQDGTPVAELRPLEIADVEQRRAAVGLPPFEP